MKDELQKALAAIKAKDAEGAKLILARLLQDEPDNVAAWVLMSRMAETEVQKAAFLRKILSIEPDHAYARQTLAALQERADDGETMAAADGVASPDASPDAPPEEDVAPEAEPAADADAAPGEQTMVEEQAKGETGPEEAAVEAQTAPPETGLPLSTEPFDYEAQAEGDTLPPWMADEEVILEAPEPAEPEAGEGEDEEAAEDIPEWLAEEPESEWLEQGTAGDETEAGVPSGAGGAGGTEEARLATPKPAGEGAARPAATGGGSGLVLGLTVVTIIVFLLLVYAAITFLPGLF